MLTKQSAALGVILLAVGLASAAPNEVRMRPVDWRAEIGRAFDLELAGPPTSADQVRVVVRSRGAQERLEALEPAGAAKPRWQFTPEHDQTYTVATTIEPVPDQPAGQVWVFEKLFLRAVAPQGSERATPVPSASPANRFGQRLELTPLVDPTCVEVGSDLPVRIKFNDADLKDAKVAVRHAATLDAAERAEPVTAETAALTTNAQGIVNIRMTAPGFWLVQVVQEAPRDDRPDAPRDQFVGSLLFELRVAEKPANEAPSNGGPRQ